MISAGHQLVVGQGIVLLIQSLAISGPKFYARLRESYVSIRFWMTSMLWMAVLSLATTVPLRMPPELTLGHAGWMISQFAFQGPLRMSLYKDLAL